MAWCCVLLGGWGCGGTYGVAVPSLAIQRMMPQVLFGPSGGYSVPLFTFLHVVHGVSLSGQVCAGDFPFPALLHQALVRSLSRPAHRVLCRECGKAPADVSCGRAGDGLTACGD